MPSISRAEKDPCFSLCRVQSIFLLRPLLSVVACYSIQRKVVGDFFFSAILSTVLFVLKTLFMLQLLLVFQNPLFKIQHSIFLGRISFESVQVES